MNDRTETVEAFARLREREVMYEEEDFDRWSIELLATWGLADKIRLRDRTINGVVFLGIITFCVGFWAAVASLVF